MLALATSEANGASYSAEAHGALLAELGGAGVRDAHLIPTARRVDVEFGEFMGDDLAMAERILGVAGMEVTDTTRSELTAIASIDGARLADGPPDAGGDGGCGDTGVARFDEPPHAARRIEIRGAARTVPRFGRATRQAPTTASARDVSVSSTSRMT